MVQVLDFNDALEEKFSLVLLYHVAGTYRISLKMRTAQMELGLPFPLWAALRHIEFLGQGSDPSCSCTATATPDPSWPCRDIPDPFLAQWELLWSCEDLNEIMRVKHLAQCLPQSEHSTNIFVSIYSLTRRSSP